jgi:hypothetical protein
MVWLSLARWATIDCLLRVFASQGDLKVALKPNGNTSGHAGIGAHIAKKDLMD